MTNINNVVHTIQDQERERITQKQIQVLVLQKIDTPILNVNN